MHAGVDAIAWMQQLAGRLDDLHARDEIETALDDVEYLVEALDPELQPAAYQLIDALNRKLAQHAR
ncbi:MAG: hypothetical protein KDJ27_14995 [Gammaproteobacteria bacterium]|nr:hypothetical protein [Gammaproteobacteria bacterium]MCB1925024.1 hypothetical protein [Gammaproteobacteria bacterium]